MNKLLKIAYFTDTFYPDVNGVSTYLQVIIRQLIKRNCQIVVYAHSKAKNPFPEGKVKLIRLANFEFPTYKEFYGCLPNPINLRKSIINENPDLLHVHTPAFLGAIALSTARTRGIPVIATFHGFLQDYHNYLSFTDMLRIKKILYKSSKLKYLKSKLDPRLGIAKRAAIKIGSFKKPLILKSLVLIYNRFGVVTVPSESATRKVRLYGIKCVTLPYALDLSSFKPKKSYKRTGRVLTVSRLGFEKSVDILIRAFALVLKHYPSAKLTIVGDGPARYSLEKLVESIGIRNSVKFEGVVKRRFLQRYFNSHDFFAFASSSETFGYVTAEAMAAGLPVAGVRAPGTVDLVKDGKNGCLSEPNDIIGFSKAMERLLDRKTDLKKLGKISALLVRRFDSGTIAEKHLQLYRNVIKKFRKSHLS